MFYKATIIFEILPSFQYLQRIPGTILDEIEQKNKSRTHNSNDKKIQRWIEIGIIGNNIQVSELLNVTHLIPNKHC